MKYFLLSMFLLLTVVGFGQISILVVDDSNDGFENTAALTTGLDNNSLTYDLFDAEGTATSPTAEYMGNYDLVIWHTSTNGVGLQFWNANDEINGQLALYLSEGGNLWVTGNDFLYDRYVTPYTFAEGEFAYDFLGIASYDSQSYDDDGGIGVDFVAPASDQPITGLDNIDWTFSTLWYADAVTGRDGSVPIYEMGGTGYVFEGETAGLWYDNGTSKCLSFFFDLALASGQSVIDNTVASVVAHFEGLISSTENIELLETEVKVFPNPASEFVQISFEEIPTSKYNFAVTNQLGQTILSSKAQSQKSFFLNRDELGTGMFNIQIVFEDPALSPITKKVLIR